MNFIKKHNIATITLFIILLILSIAVIICIFKEKYEISIGIAAILASIVVPFCTKNLELEKHQRQFLYEKKYNAYSKYFEICDKFWRISGQTVINIHLLNTAKYNSKEEFEKQKDKTLELFKEFNKIRDYLSMPGIEILIFTNNKIDKKIKEIVALDVNPNSIINSKDELENNIKKAEKYIQIISELTSLLKEDLGIKE